MVPADEKREFILSEGEVSAACAVAPIVNCMRPYLLMLGGAGSFAVMGTLAHAAGKYCEWQLIAVARSLVAMLLALTLTRVHGARLVIFRPPVLWLRSLAGSASVMCNFFALSQLHVADALTLINMFPVWIAVLSWPMLGRMPARDVWLSVGCCMTGVVLMYEPGVSAGLGTLLGFTGSVTSAIALIGLHRLRGIDPNAIVAHFSAVSVLTLVGVITVSPLSDRTLTQLTHNPVLAALLVGTGVFAGIGQLLLTRAFAAGAPARVSVVSLTQVVFAMGFDYFLWNRELEWQMLPAMLLILAPTAWMILQRPRGADE